MDFFSLTLNGLSSGAIYALVALGMVIVFKATDVLNFAHPAVLVLGTYIVAILHTAFGWPFFAAAATGIVVSVLLGIIIERLLVRPFSKRQEMLAAGIMTIGLSIVLETLLAKQIGARIMSTGDPWGNDTVQVFGASISAARLAALIVAAILLLTFYLWLQRSDFGVGMRAAADDPETASLMGVSLSRTSMVAWGLAAGLATVAGIFLVSYPSAGLDVTVSVVVFNAIPAAVIGGMDSTTGAVVGGLIVGLAQSYALGYQEALSFLGNNFAPAAPYLIMLIVLLIRPAGLFGTKEVSRV